MHIQMTEITGIRSLQSSSVIALHLGATVICSIGGGRNEAVKKNTIKLSSTSKDMILVIEKKNPRSKANTKLSPPPLQL